MTDRSRAPQTRRTFAGKIRSVSARRHDNTLLFRLVRAAGLLVFVFVFGTFGYFIIGDGKYDLVTCAYMTVITLTSIGYGEVIQVTGHRDRMIFTMILIIAGMGLMLYFVSALTAFIVDGDLRDLLQKRKMHKRIDRLKDHIIVAGLGSVGRYVLTEIVAGDRDCLIIEQNEERILDALEQVGVDLPYLIGDATEDELLLDARLHEASGVIFSLGNDRDNLFATISARQLNPDVRIVTRGEHPQSERKFEMAGADEVIFTNVLGGMRMAAEVLRPQVTTFLELMMHDHDHFRRIEEFTIPASSPLIGKTLREANLRAHTDALIVAVYDVARREYIYNPGPNYVLTSGSKLIILLLIEDRYIIIDFLHGHKK